MRLLITALFIMMLSATANAVVVTFEDAYEPYVGSGPGDSAADDHIDTPQGFAFGYPGESSGSYFPMLNEDSENNKYMSSVGYGYMPDSIHVWRQDGKLFDLNSLDLLTRSSLTSDPNYDPEDSPGYERSDSTINAYAADNSLIASWSSDSLNTQVLDWYTVDFNSDWTDIDYLTINTPWEYAPVEPLYLFVDGIAVDNFNATVVPVPAAIWLFISGLSVLGFRRRLR